MEFMRFMRYVLPGLVVTTQFLLVLFISYLIDDPIGKALNEKLSFNLLMASDGADKVLGILTSTLLVSGGVGYVFSVVYYIIRDSTDWFFDHKPSLQCLMDEGYLVLSVVGSTLEHENVVRKIKRLDGMKKKKAWEIFHVLWYRVLDDDKSLEKNWEVVSRQIDIAHGQGAILVGSAIALVLWLVLVIQVNGGIENNCHFRLVIFFLWLGFALLSFKAYRATRDAVANNLNNALITSVKKHKIGSYKIFFVGNPDEMK